MTETYMSAGEFERNEATILADVCAILVEKGKKRTQFQEVAVYERDTSQRLAEVLQTSCGLVVVYRAAAIQTPEGSPSHLDIRDFRREHAMQPFTGEPHQLFPMKGKSTIYVVLGKNIIDRAYPGNALVFKP